MKRQKEPRIFAGYIHDQRGPMGTILSTCCEGPECLICASDPAAAKRANNKHFPWPDKDEAEKVFAEIDRLRRAPSPPEKVTGPTPSASDLERASAVLAPMAPVYDRDIARVAAEFAAIRAEAKAEQHIEDVKMLRDNMHLFLPIHEGLDVARRIADFLEQAGPK